MSPFLPPSPRRVFSRLFASAGVLALVAGTALTAGAQGVRTILATRVATPAVNSADAGSFPASQRLTLTLTMRSTAARAAALDQYLVDLTTASSPNFHRWLTPADFASRFGATPDQLAAVRGWASSEGLTVEGVATSGLRVTISGPTTQVQTAFQTTLHAYAAGTTTLHANLQQPSLPDDTAALFTAVEGLDTLPAPVSLRLANTSLRADATDLDAFAEVVNVVEANRVASLALMSSASADALAPTQIAEYTALCKQAAAQGIAVLSTATNSRNPFPASLAEITAVAVAGTPLVAADASLSSRPPWQSAAGLPADGLRHVPDLTVSSIAAFTQTLNEIAGSGRLGNVSATLYALAPEPGLFAQPDHAPAGTWEPATGLGLVDLQRLATVYPRGTGSSFTSFQATNYSPIHGQGTSFTSVVTSGNGGATPTGTVSFITTAGVTLGTAPLVNGTASLTLMNLDGGNYTLNAVYSGDATYASSSSGKSQLFVQPEPSALTVAVGGNPVIGGSFTVTVTDTAPSGVGNPTGPVSVTISGTTSTYTATLMPAGTGASTASVTIPATTPGTITLSVTCMTSANYSCFNPYTTTVTIAKATPTLSISFQPNPPVSGATIALNAAVTTAGNAPAPTGSVTFYDNGTTLNASKLANGATSTTGIVPTTSTHSITATYAGDPNYNSVSTTASSTSSGTIPTITNLQASTTSITAGQSITFTATVAPSSTGPANPTGTVQFFDAGTLIGTANVSANVATFAISTLSPTSTHSITATYSGDGYYGSSGSAPVVLSRSNAGVTTSTSLSASSSTAVAGQSITLTATIGPASTTAPNPTGSVSFFDGSTLLGSASVAGNVASFATAALASNASHAVIAVYSGDGTYNGSTSQPVTIGKSTSTIPTTTALTSSSTVIAGSQPITLTATVTPSAAGAASASGNVFFYDGTALLGSGSLTSTNGGSTMATLTTANIGPAASHALTAVYAGDSSYTGSTSPVLTINRGPSNGNSLLPTTTTLSVSTTASTSGSPVVFTATIAPSAATGSVQFLSGAIIICTATVSGGVATCPSITLPTGVDSVTAAYGGDTLYAPSVSGPTIILVSPPTTPPNATLMVNVTPSTAAPGATAIVNVTVTSTTGTTLAGGITVTINGVVYTAALSGTASSNTVAVPVVVPMMSGTYGVTVACTGTTLVCNPAAAILTSGTTAVSTLIPTTTVLAATASMTTPTSYALTATIAPIRAGASPVSGTVIFFDGTTPIAVAIVTAGAATTTANIAATGTHSLTAVYSGDTLYATSTSAAVTPTGTGATTVPFIVLSANVSSSLAGGNVVLTASVAGVTAKGAVPTGLVTFYNAAPTPRVLGTATLGTAGSGLAVAVLSTTQIPAGSQSVYAAYAGDTNFTNAVSNQVSIGVANFTLNFVPASITLAAGATGQATVSYTATNNFSGTVTLGCTPQPNTFITCSFSPGTLISGGTSTLTVVTTAPTRQSTQTTERAGLGVVGGLSLAGLLCLLLPRRRRRVPMLLTALLALAMLTNLGCSDGSFNPAGTLTGGTPLGTALLTITSAATDGVNTVRHTDAYQVTVQ